MRTAWQWAFMACSALCLGAVAYDVAYFRPALVRMHAAIREHPAQDQHPPEFAVDLLEFTMHGDTVPYAPRLLLRHFDANGRPSSGVSWQLKYTAWCEWVALQTSERDRLALIASYAATGLQRQGLTETAEDLFGLPPTALSRRQMAVVVALIQVPSIGQGAYRPAALGDGLLAAYDAAARGRTLHAATAEP